MFDELKNMLKHSLYYMIGPIASRLVGFVMIPVYTRYLSPTDFGILEMLDFTLYIISMFAVLGINKAMMRYYYEYSDEKSRNLVLTTCLISTLLTGAITTGILIYYSPFLSNIIFDSPQYSYFFQILLASNFADIIMLIPLSILRVKEKSILYIIFTVFRMILGLSLNIYFVVILEMGIVGILYSNLLSVALTCIGLTYTTFRKIRFRFSWDIFIKVFKYGFPLIFDGMGSFIINFGNRYFLKRYSTLHIIGLFGLGFKLSFALALFLHGPFNLMWGAMMFKLANRDDARLIFSKVLTYYSYVCIFGALAVALLAKDVLQLLVTPEFVEAHKIVPLLMSGLVFYFMISVFESGILIVKKTQMRAFITIVSAAVNMVANWILIPKYDMVGASVASIISYLLWALLTLAVSQRVYKIKYEYFRILKLLFVAYATFAVGKMAVSDPIYLSVTVKAILVILFPFSLFLVNFYNEQEKQKIKLYSNTLYYKIKKAI